MPGALHLRSEEREIQALLEAVRRHHQRFDEIAGGAAPTKRGESGLRLPAAQALIVGESWSLLFELSKRATLLRHAQNPG
jgi:hypothetical protein